MLELARKPRCESRARKDNKMSMILKPEGEELAEEKRKRCEGLRDSLGNISQHVHDFAALQKELD